MIAAMSALQVGHPISPNVRWPRPEVDLELSESDLAPAELFRLLREIESLQLAGLLTPASGDRNFGPDRAA
jgi:hypothetical protein